MYVLLCDVGYYNSVVLFFSEDLWAHLSEASGKPVAEVMSAWTQKLGYPVLSVDGKQVAFCCCCLHHAQCGIEIALNLLCLTINVAEQK